MRQKKSLFSVFAGPKLRQWLKAIFRKPKRPRRGQKEHIMAKAIVSSTPAAQGPTAPVRHQPDHAWRGPLTILATAVTIVLAGCGGGGGDSPAFGGNPPIVGSPAPVPAPSPAPPAPAPSPAPAPAPAPPPGPSGSVNPGTGDGTAGTFSVPAGEAGRSYTLSYTVQNATNPKVVAKRDGQVVAETGPLNPAATTVSLTVPGVGQFELVLQNGNGNPIAANVLESRCERWSTWSVPLGKCYYHYDRANVVISNEVFLSATIGGPGLGAVGYPQLLEGSTRIVPKNETGSQVGLCVLGDKLLPTGLIATQCARPLEGNVAAVFQLDPVTHELRPAYTGPLPEGLVWRSTLYGTFGDVPPLYFANGVVQQGQFIDVPGVGTYFWTDSGDLRLTRDSFATSDLIQTGWSFRLLMTYTNSAPAN